ncbi:GatB/YqeY domain-containing protein [Methylonatrum kenyense]|uniref:GatB/YqeY domain-containing protein n=1 Tax=Methylonatrum kenyense TaxID=455253 RepID=UPI0020BDF257|nr:GatB/YqeY domain-containing protein [Methylonatrum kenyense]MCK8515401.1 GatB/YqeY domain-containing protein [Methylonatrum kenyense]
MRQDSALLARLQDEIKQAMRAGDKRRLGLLRLVSAAVKQREVDERISLSDDDVVALLSKQVKQRQESIAQYESAGRDDLAEQERYEITVLQEFLPQPLDDAEIDRLVDAAITQTAAESMRDMGKVMGVLRPQVQGRADMAAVSARIKTRLQ